MLDLKLLQKEPETVAAALKARNSKISMDEFLEMDKRRRAAHIAALKHGLVSPDIRAGGTGPHARGYFRLVGIQPEYVKSA